MTLLPSTIVKMVVKRGKPAPHNRRRVVLPNFLNLASPDCGCPYVLNKVSRNHFCNDPFAKVMLKIWELPHRIATAFHPQTSGQSLELQSWLERILERTVGTDIAKITRKRSKPDKHGHGNGIECAKAGRMLSWSTVFSSLVFLEHDKRNPHAQSVFQQDHLKDEIPGDPRTSIKLNAVVPFPRRFSSGSKNDVTKDMVCPNNKRNYLKSLKPLVVAVENQNPVSEPVVAPISAPMPNPKPFESFLSRRDYDEKRREIDNDH
ncbi:hypothetical protein Tco_1146193 [Tanacetum coccineum]